MRTLMYLADVTFKNGQKLENVDKVDVGSALLNILNLAYFFAGITAVIVIIVAGIIYATSGGDSGHTRQAREAIIYAVVGLVVVMMAFVITGFISGEF